MNIKNIILVAKSECKRWIINPRLITIFVIFIPVRELVIVPMILAASEINQPLEIFEPCIAVLNQGLLVILFAVIYFILIAKFPTMDGNLMLYIFRMGRKNWFIGEIVFQLCSSFLYCLIIVLVNIFQTVSVSFAANGWSVVVTDYDKLSDGTLGIHMDSIITPKLFFQMTPYKAFILSFLFFWIFIMICSMFLMLGCMYGKKLHCYILLFIQMVVGYCLCEFVKAYMWFLPFSHILLSMHYQDYLREYVFPPEVSMCILFLLLMVELIAGYRRVNKVSVDMIGGSVLP